MEIKYVEYYYDILTNLTQTLSNNNKKRICCELKKGVVYAS